jgi:uncharacterized membrane protein YfcA
LSGIGGSLLVPMDLVVTRMPFREALANSLVVSAALAVPGTVVHAVLGDIRWDVVVVYGLASVPLAHLGARTVLRLRSEPLERLYGGVLLVLALVLLITVR